MYTALQVRGLSRGRFMGIWTWAQNRGRGEITSLRISLVMRPQSRIGGRSASCFVLSAPSFLGEIHNRCFEKSITGGTAVLHTFSLSVGSRKHIDVEKMWYPRPLILWSHHAKPGKVLQQEDITLYELGQFRAVYRSATPLLHWLILKLRATILQMHLQLFQQRKLYLPWIFKRSQPWGKWAC